jgi:hypothetical protein
MKKKLSQDIFLQQLQQQAKLQSKLNKTRLFPKQVDPLTSLIGNYSWQFLLVLSGITAVGLWWIHGK